jgi:predicted TPR repeat methyltransferase
MGGGKAGTAKGAGAKLAGAIALHQRGELAQAETAYLDILAADPQNVDALHFLGVARHQQGQSLQGMDLVRRAIAIRPDYFDAVNNLGNIQQQLGCTVDAVKAYQRALELRPDHPDASRNLGIALRKVKRFEEAAEVYRRAIERWPDKVENYYGLANACKDMARFDEALATLRKALAVHPEPGGFRRLGQMLYGARRIEEAAANYEAWLRFEPDSPVARHMLAACTGKDVPQRAGDAFVTRVFDGFAEDFDEVLNRLEYRAPALVGAALQRVEGEPRGALDILDAGCGTGLLAQHLRPYARRLVGADLSPKMLGKAARRGTYDELIAAELTEYLASSPQAFDVVASSDTLVYFGELREVLCAAAAALRDGGRLVFTLEYAASGSEAPAGYRIHPHGRYSHTEPYVRGVLAQAGFEVLDIENERLRWEGRDYVAGLLVCARLAQRPQRAAAPPLTTLRARLAAAVALHRQGELHKAEAIYLEVLEADEANHDALHALGLMRRRQGRLLSALNLVRRAIDADPASVDAYHSLGDIYRQLGMIAGAAEAYKSALELQPDHEQACRSRASVLEELARLEEAAQAHRLAFEHDPADAAHLYRLAAVLQEIGGRTEEELETLRKALAIRPDADAFRRVGIILSGRGRLDEAAANYEAWLRAEPDNALARHLLAACTGKDVPERASDASVRQGFDRFADGFDELLAKLEYRAPALVGSALRRIGGEPRGDLDVVDAGCGTGLLAPYLRAYARRLVGVDLSSRMLEKAAARALYDELVTAELAAYLQAAHEAFDIVACADTLVYFGDLRDVLAAARRALRGGGMLVFTVEHATSEEQAPAGYRLQPEGRYVHTERYVRSCLAQAGFAAVEAEKAYLRREGEAYVAGLVVAAR